MDIAGRPRIESGSVLDLCAGTGAVGLEALSWGASHCCFVDRNRAATAFIRGFLREHDAMDSATVITGDLRKYISRVSPPPDVLFIDPPYNARDLYDWIDRFDWRGFMDGRGVVFIESGHEPELEGGWQMRRYGDSYLKYIILDG